MLRDLDELSGDDSFHTASSEADCEAGKSSDGDVSCKAGPSPGEQAANSSRGHGRASARCEARASERGLKRKRNSSSRAGAALQHANIPVSGEGMRVPNLLQQLPSELLLMVLQQLAPPEW